MTAPSARPHRLVAIIAAFNEEDIIGPVIAHLVEQGAGVYLLDDGSTDGTVAVASEFAGKGLIAVEALRQPAQPGGNTFSLSRILERKEQLAQRLDADWFINQDADEFRDSPWPHLSLAEAVALVGRLGWNAIDFDVFDFVPDDEEYRVGDDPRQRFRRCRPAADYNRLQIRCWKKTAEKVDLVSTGGHETIFTGRRVFPIRFPMRHYPLRSAEHARRKVNQERRPRFDPAERARGWHIHYDRFVEGAPIPPGDRPLQQYDADAARIAAQIANRLVESAGVSLARDNASDLAESIARLEEAVSRQRAAQADSESRLREATGRLSELVERLERQRSENEALRAAQAETESRLSQVAAHVGELSERLDRERRENEALRAALAERDAGLVECDARLSEAATRLNELTESVDRERHCSALLGAARDATESALAEASNRMNRLSAENSALRQTIDQLGDDEADLSRRLADVFASRSWRITRPLRAIWRALGGK